jgi:Uma2 family endonuclease
MAIVAIDGPHAAEMPDTSELIAEDGIPMDSPWHRACIALLIQVLSYAWRHRDDFYVGGNMFIYFSAEQARNRDYRGPDFFVVNGVPRLPVRPYWAVWLEGYHYPDLIIELISPSTEMEDRTTKKAIYEETFHTHEYLLHDPATHQTEGWRLGPDGRYQPIVPDARGWLWSESLGLWIGNWEGSYGEVAEPAIWPRFYTPDGELLALESEVERQRAAAQLQQAEAARQQAEAARQQAEAARQQAEAEHQRAIAAEEELARLKALVAELQGDRARPPGPGA